VPSGSGRYHARAVGTEREPKVPSESRRYRARAKGTKRELKVPSESRRCRARAEGTEREPKVPSREPKVPSESRRYRARAEGAEQEPKAPSESRRRRARAEGAEREWSTPSRNRRCISSKSRSRLRAKGARTPSRSWRHIPVASAAACRDSQRGSSRSGSAGVEAAGAHRVARWWGQYWPRAMQSAAVRMRRRDHAVSRHVQISFSPQPVTKTGVTWVYNVAVIRYP
jgi:hypothetical protein